MVAKKQELITEIMGSNEPSGSYFSPSISPMDGGHSGLRSNTTLEGFFDEALFIVSGCNTPMIETAPVTDSVITSTKEQHKGRSDVGQSRVARLRNDAQTFSASSDNIVVGRSNPIPILYPEPKPPPPVGPVSARGDLAEAYFPMHEHEDEREQVYQPHPFSQEAKKARQRSIIEAEACVVSIEKVHRSSIISHSKVTTKGAVQTGRVASERQIAGADKVPDSTKSVSRQTDATRRARTAPVVDAYNPTGLPGSAALLGKYYPSNYKAPDAVDSAPQSPAPPSESSVSLPESDQARAARRLRQYKRDMITQTLQKANETFGSTTKRTASISAVETMLDEGARKSVASGFALLRRYKPLSPRIAPLLSPGPVTPMVLDDNVGSDYLTARGVKPR